MKRFLLLTLAALAFAATVARAQDAPQTTQEQMFNAKSGTTWYEKPDVNSTAIGRVSEETKIPMTNYDPESGWAVTYVQKAGGAVVNAYVRLSDLDFPGGHRR